MSVGEKTSGGWKPILGINRFDVIDWICPVCKTPIWSDISGSCKCLVHDLPVKAKPVWKLDSNLLVTHRRSFIKGYRDWWHTLAQDDTKRIRLLRDIAYELSTYPAIPRLVAISKQLDEIAEGLEYG
jgi:hypothetical protein